MNPEEHDTIRDDQLTEPLWIDYYFFRYAKDKLAGATPDQIVAFYVDRFIFHNEGYLESIVAKYSLPNDILRMHRRICRLVDKERKEREHGTYNIQDNR